MKYRVVTNDQALVETEWSPLAQAAWHRATRDENAGRVELFRDGQMLARVMPERGRGHRWPDGEECNLRDVLKTLLQLLRDDGWDAKELADRMTEHGLPTSRSRIEGMRGAAGKRSTPSHAEIVVMLDAVLDSYKKAQQQEDGLHSPKDVDSNREKR